MGAALDRFYHFYTPPELTSACLNSLMAICLSRATTLRIRLYDAAFSKPASCSWDDIIVLAVAEERRALRDGQLVLTDEIECSLYVHPRNPYTLDGCAELIPARRVVDFATAEVLKPAYAGHNRRVTTMDPRNKVKGGILVAESRS